MLPLSIIKLDGGGAKSMRLGIRNSDTGEFHCEAERHGLLSVTLVNFNCRVNDFLVDCYSVSQVCWR